MIRHCVLIRFQQSFAAAGRAAIYRDLEALRAKLPGMRRVMAGANVSPEG